ncbi:MAG: Gfo/Idh/MocA family oxidoreductase [Lentisphaerae bacterium]|jgi:predicted dehydrogenase|nr:Gfo/Idh/MocA family oxidoreductase [Lentisphaerota bacterium]MBT4814107.1 Gfo/Idh/MocA family oxidoreductase [Lentisphaerota bacterium]MBT5611114.1 Gfo/Idh/MocA family oxidoreductase [Lentisphaerota bacterium]MBT7061280.1 Gfo/Idh/MocA family oxidoreductase [Lentisphaerota bacterium]MBT7846603.1 Gfo/Idh/MocA family oxidoreductase [Lentisphaerota bacterium]
MPDGIGILGFAHGHVGAYCTRWRQNPDWGVRVIAGWDHESGRLQSAAEQHQLAACESVQQLLSRPDIKAVVIAAETSRHAELVEAAAAAGKAVILQKPMALTMAEADRIVAAVDQAAVPFTMAWQMRVDAQNLKMKELLESGELGQVFMVRRRHGLPVGLNPTFAESWHVAPECNRDIWADDAAHPIDMINWLFGLPETVTAEMVTLYRPAMPMDNGIAVFRYADGPLVEVCCSFVNTAAENTTEIICEKGSIVQNYGDVPSCNVPRPEGAVGLKWYIKETGEWVHSDLPTPTGHGERIGGLAQPLAEFVAGTRGSIATAEEGRTSLKMVLACYVSSREGRRVSLADPKIMDV